jgi:hypothetical protein
MTRLLIPLALAFGFAACTAPPPATSDWQKAGATPATVSTDTEQCRSVARQQAARLYPYSSNVPAVGGAGMIAAQQAANTDRDSAQLQAFNDCMDSRGYTRTQKPST